jgi:hypothetical protein
MPLRFRTALATIALLLVPAPALAQSPPDLSGFWSPDLGAQPADEELLPQLPPNTVIIHDTGVVEFGRGDFGGLKLKPEALAKAEAWKPEDEMTVARVCAAPSIVYSIQGPFPFEVHQTPELIVFRYEYFDQVRLIFMDGRQHPVQDAPHSRMGHSVGRWEGDELVIDTTHILPSTITNNGLDHSADIHMVERYRLSDDGTQLSAVQWFEDPAVLDNNGARYIAWTKRPGQAVYPYDCDPSFALEYADVGEAPGE